MPDICFSYLVKYVMYAKILAHVRDPAQRFYVNPASTEYQSSGFQYDHKDA